MQGSHGELLQLGMPFMLKDINNPRVRQEMMMAQRRMGYADPHIYYPFGMDLARTLNDILNMAIRKNGGQPVEYRAVSTQPFPAPGARCAHITGTVSGGTGPGEFNTMFCVTQPNQFGMYSAYYSGVLAPAAVADQERATLAAVLESYGTDQARIQGQAAAIAKPVIDRIHAEAQANQIRIKSIQDAGQANLEATYDRWNEQDKRAQAFSNYLLDRSVIRDVEDDAHGTFSDRAAAALVNAFPDRFEYVQTQDFRPGVDYHTPGEGRGAPGR